MSDAYLTESRNYWRAAQMLSGELRKTAPDPDIMEDAVSEIEAIVLYTQQPQLRLLAQRMLARASNFTARVARS